MRSVQPADDLFSVATLSPSLELDTVEAPPTAKKTRQEHKDRPRPPPAVTDPAKDLIKLFNSFSHRYNRWQVFSDFCEMGAIMFSNKVDFFQAEKREERYMQIVKGYQRDEVYRLSEGLGMLVMALERGFSDVLGRTFHELELHNKWVGQFFTPYPVCQMMAQMTIADRGDLDAKIKERGFVTAQEPACGSGAMVIALAEAMYDAGINYQQHLHVTAIDVDLKCVHMAYLQFTLYNIPAVIVHGNTLTLEEHSHWYTPAHMMGMWSWKLRRPSEGTHEVQAPPSALIEAAEPVVIVQEPKGEQGQLKLF
jgi:hypothetical protein